MPSSGSGSGSSGDYRWSIVAYYDRKQRWRKRVDGAPRPNRRQIENSDGFTVEIVYDSGQVEYVFVDGGPSNWDDLPDLIDAEVSAYESYGWANRA